MDSLLVCHPVLSMQCDRIKSYDDIVSKVHMTGPKDVKLKLGFVAVRNRTKEELENGTTLEQARRFERQMFDTHPVLCKISKDRAGVDALSKKIVALQRQTVHARLYPPACPEPSW